MALADRTGEVGTSSNATVELDTADQTDPTAILEGTMKVTYETNLVSDSETEAILANDVEVVAADEEEDADLLATLAASLIDDEDEDFVAALAASLTDGEDADLVAALAASMND